MSASPAPLAVFASFSGTGGVERMLVSLIRGSSTWVRRWNWYWFAPRARTSPGSRPRCGGSRSVPTTPCSPPRPWRAICASAVPRRSWPPRTGPDAPRCWPALAGTGTPIALRLGTHLSTAMAGRGVFARWLRYLPIRLLYPRIERIVAVSNGVAAGHRPHCPAAAGVHQRDPQPGHHPGAGGPGGPALPHPGSTRAGRRSSSPPGDSSVKRTFRPDPRLLPGADAPGLPLADPG